jgi:hypothetical protein
MPHHHPMFMAIQILNRRSQFSHPEPRQFTRFTERKKQKSNAIEQVWRGVAHFDVPMGDAQKKEKIEGLYKSP